MQFKDALTLDAPKRTADGYMAVRARAARSGVYQYAGFEVDPDNKHGLKDTAVVNVLRDEATVFDRAAVQSFIGKPVTNDHPAVSVNAGNWKDHARGIVMGALKDGEYLAFDLMLTDQATIDAVQAGKRELSNGYSAELEFGEFKAADGTVCQVRQSRIKGGNHVAIVDQGRAGPECRINDGFAICDANLDGLPVTTKEKPAMATITVDGLPVSLAGESAVRAVIEKKDAAIADAAKALSDAAKALSDANEKVGVLTGEKAALEKQLADAKAELDPAVIDKRVADRAALVAAAKGIKADIVTDGKTDAAIKAEIVAAKLGDSHGLDEAGISGAFLMLSKDNKVVSIPAPAVTDAAAGVIDARNARNAALAVAYKGK